MHTLLKSLGHSDGLELMAAPQKPFQKFVPTGKTSKDFFVVGTRTQLTYIAKGNRKGGISDANEHT